MSCLINRNAVKGCGYGRRRGLVSSVSRRVENDAEMGGRDRVSVVT
jgi:hypothetical protein